VRHDLETVHKLNPEIGTEARVPLPDDPEVDVGYADLLKWEDVEGADYSFWPEKAKRKYTVGELLAGVRNDGASIRVEREPPLNGSQPAQPLVSITPGGWWADYNLWAIASGSIIGTAVALSTWVLGLPPLLATAAGLAGGVIAANYVRSRNPDTLLHRLLGMFGVAGLALLYHATGPRFEIGLPAALGGGLISIGASRDYWPLVIWLVALALLLATHAYQQKLKKGY
jgi:hypothetical protein